MNSLSGGGPEMTDSRLSIESFAKRVGFLEAISIRPAQG
jgi:hypothetical protein